MDQSTVERATTLRIVRRISASRERVFDALINPSVLSKWFAPTDDFEAYVDRFEAEEGGTYRIEMRHSDGNVYTCHGTIQEIASPERLVYTWSWEGGDMGDTLVTWELEEEDGETELTLVHDRFPDAEAKARHLEGWTGAVGRLQRIF